MEQSYGFPSNYFKTNTSLSGEFHASYDPVITESKGMQKTPEFHASYDPIVTESKGMLKTPEFHASYDPVVTESKGMEKKLQNFTQGVQA